MRMPINKKITFIVIAVALAIMAVVYFVFDPTTTRLFPKCAFYARTHGGGTIMLTSRPQRVAANQLYQSLGMQLKPTNVYQTQ